MRTLHYISIYLLMAKIFVYLLIATIFQDFRTFNNPDHWIDFEVLEQKVPNK